MLQINVKLWFREHLGDSHSAASHKYHAMDVKRFPMKKGLFRICTQFMPADLQEFGQRKLRNA